MKVYFLITSVFYVLHIIIVVPHSVDGMVLQDGELSHLDLLIMKSMRYKHHKENYFKSLEEVLHHRDYKSRKNSFFTRFKRF